MKATVCILALALAALAGCQSGRSHQQECCAEQRFYPNGTVYPGARNQRGAVSPAGYRAAQAMVPYQGMAPPAGTPQSPQYPAPPPRY